MRGFFSFEDQLIPNRVPNGGEEAYLKMIFQNNDAILAGGANFYIGLCGDINDLDATLADITGEPTTGGYARQPIARNTTGWPTVVLSDGHYQARSANVTFAASGANIGPFSRLFLCNAASGTSGVLFAISGMVSGGALTIPDGQSRSVSYRIYLF